MLQSSPIALAQVKAGHIWKITKWNKINHISFLSSKTKSLKK